MDALIAGGLAAAATAVTLALRSRVARRVASASATAHARAQGPLVVLLSCDEVERTVGSGWSAVYGDSAVDDAPLWRELSALQVPFVRVSWTSPRALRIVKRAAAGGGCLVVTRQTWDYSSGPARLQAFLAALQAMQEAGATLWNDLRLIQWSSHKSYLGRLHGAGVVTVSTLQVPPAAEGGQRVNLNAAAQRLSARHGLVIKPAIGGSARGSVLVDDLSRAPAVRAAEAYLHAAGGWSVASRVPVGDGPGKWSGEVETMLVQAFAPSIRQHGELSVVVVLGHITHAVVKRPAAGGGDFKVQAEYGGWEEVTTLPHATHEVVHSILRKAARQAGLSAPSTGAPLPEAGLPLARVDFLRCNDSNRPESLQVMEVECVEPQLFFAHFPAAAKRLAKGMWAWHRRACHAQAKAKQ